MKRGTIEWRPIGNTGREVLVTGEDAARDEDRDGPRDELDQLRAEVDQLREERKEARIAAARAEAMVEPRDLLLAELRTELQRFRRPWLVRLFGG